MKKLLAAGVVPGPGPCLGELMMLPYTPKSNPRRLATPYDSLIPDCGAQIVVTLNVSLIQGKKPQM